MFWDSSWELAIIDEFNSAVLFLFSPCLDSNFLLLWFESVIFSWLLFAVKLDSILEFETYIGDILVNGVDMIRWNDQGKIVDFKVMVRPLQAIGALQKKMSEALELLKK